MTVNQENQVDIPYFLKDTVKRYVQIELKEWIKLKSTLYNYGLFTGLLVGIAISLSLLALFIVCNLPMIYNG